MLLWSLFSESCPLCQHKSPTRHQAVMHIACVVGILHIACSVGIGKSELLGPVTRLDGRQ